MKKINAALALQVLPRLGTEDQEASFAVIDRVIEEIAASGLHYEVGAFETTVEGDFAELMSLLQRCLETAVVAGAKSLLSHVKIHYAPGGELPGIDEKTAKHRH
ncbi:MAG: thiamine-binding protein [Bacillota bacterium]|nr:thiamine-binding protein [Bacillota bacterium]